MNNLSHNIKEYIQANFNLIKLEISDEIGGIISKLIMVLFGLFASLVLLLLFLAVVLIGVSQWLDSYLYGSLATLGIFVVLFALIFIFFKKKLNVILTNQIYKDMIDKMTNPNENETNNPSEDRSLERIVQVKSRIS